MLRARLRRRRQQPQRLLKSDREPHTGIRPLTWYEAADRGLSARPGRAVLRGHHDDEYFSSSTCWPAHREAGSTSTWRCVPNRMRCWSPSARIGTTRPRRRPAWCAGRSVERQAPAVRAVVHTVPVIPLLVGCRPGHHHLPCGRTQRLRRRRGRRRNRPVSASWPARPPRASSPALDAG